MQAALAQIKEFVVLGDFNFGTAPSRGVTACVPPQPNELYRMAYLKLKIHSRLEGQ